MHRTRANSAVCMVALAAYVLNLAFVASGAVLCRDADSRARIEFACDHGHCETTVEQDHEHDPHEPCMCSTCPCEDDPLGTAVTATRNRDVDHGRDTSAFHGAPVHEFVVTPYCARRTCAVPTRPPPGVAPQIRALRTIVLIV